MALVTCTNEEYHACMNADSHSSIDLFRRSRERYAAIRVHRTLRPEPPTPAMAFGTAFGYALLEPHEFAKRYITAKSFDRRTTLGKAQAIAFDAAAVGKTPISEEDCSLIRNMIDGVMRNPKARQAIEGAGKVEQSVTWDDPATGLPLKFRPDKLLDNGLIWDLKTAADSSPEAWAKACANFGYHRQAALYLDGAWQALQVDGPFVFVVVGKEPPHECVCYCLDSESLSLGRKQNATAIRELVECKRTGNWSGKWGNRIIETSLPRWAFFGD